MMNYAQQIKDPRWQKKRLEVLSDNNFECENCGSSKDTLNVHHPFYKRGAMIWEYGTDELQCLCEVCHKEAHALDEKIKKAFAYATTDHKLKALGALESYELWSGYDDNATIKILGVDHAEGICEAFGGIKPSDLILALSDDSTITKDRLLALRTEVRLKLGLPVMTPTGLITKSVRGHVNG
jgi:hypothetical protein